MSAPSLPASRAAARAHGSRFYLATECPLHPAAPRYTANARCVECCKAERRLAAPDRRDHDAARKRAWRASRSELANAADQFADLLG